MVTSKALGSQKGIAHRVRDAGVDYVFALKNNRPARCRGHWHIENNQHGMLRVVFREDDNSNPTGHAQNTLSMVRADGGSRHASGRRPGPVSGLAPALNIHTPQ